MWHAGKEKNWAVIAAALWWAGYTVLYALRLPVTYQHGRYLIPGMPVYFVMAFLGIRTILQNIAVISPTSLW